MKHLLILIASFLSASVSFADGGLQVNGTPGPSQLFQKVKAVRCNTSQRGQCDAAIFFNLNQPTSVPAGSYIVGFENSIQPGLVEVREGRTTVLRLERLNVPAGIKGTRIKVFRDFSTVIEQNKVLTSMYYMGRHLFRLSKENFSDLYLTGTWERDFVQRLTYEACVKVPKLKDDGYQVPKESIEKCEVWTKAQSPIDLEPLFRFEDEKFSQLWVTYPGHIHAISHPRYLVAALVSQGEFVAVFPGAYRFLQGGAQESVAVSTAGGY